MNLKHLCETYQNMRMQGFAFDTVEQIMAKIPEELEEVKKAIKAGDLGHLKEELGDLIQATLVLCDFLEIKGDEALETAVTKLQKRFESYKALARAQGMDLKNASYKDKLILWEKIKGSPSSN